MMMAAGIGLLDYVWYKTFIFEDFRVIGRPQQVVGAPDLPAGSPYPVVHCAEDGDEWDEPWTVSWGWTARCTRLLANGREGMCE